MSLINIGYQDEKTIRELPSILDRVTLLNGVAKNNQEMLEIFEEGKYRDEEEYQM